MDFNPGQYLIFFLSPVGMVLVAVASAAYWQGASGTRWRWFWVGAALWTVGVGLKFLWAIRLNKSILGAAKAALPRVLYLGVGSLYVGALTGVFEIGVTLVAALIWTRLAREPRRAVAVGVGAGAFEALLVGLAVAVGVLAALSGRSPEGAEALAGVAAVTPLAWLVGPVERVIAILCHTSSRALVLLAVARRRWSYFWWGFFIMTAIDTVAGFAHLSGLLAKVNMWWVELAIVPFALASVPIISWCLCTWPAERDSSGKRPPESQDVDAAQPVC